MRLAALLMRPCSGSVGASTSSITAFKVREKYEAGLRLLGSGNVYEAIQLFQEASFFDAENVLPMVALAECYIFLCDLRSAVRCYRRVLWSLHKQEMDAFCQSARDDTSLSEENGHANASAAAFALPHDHLHNIEDAADTAVMQLNHSSGAAFLVEATSSEHRGSFGSTGPSPRGGEGAAAAIKETEPLSVSQRDARGSFIGGAGDATGLAPETLSPPRPLSAKDVRPRLAGVLDALGLSLYQVGNVEQALRCTTEALELLDAAAQIGEGDAIDTSAAQNPQFLADPTIALHRGVYLMALQRDEEAEPLLTDHYAVFEEWRPQTAALLAQLYCNRQAFRKARVLLEKQEEKKAASPIDAPTPQDESEKPNGVEQSSQEDNSKVRCSPSSEAAVASLAVAKYLFTELYTRYRAAALASNDEASITRCLGIYSTDVDLLFRRAELCLATGQHKKSIKDLFRCVRETNGEHKAAIEAMTNVLFTIGSSLSGKSDLQDALAYYSESLKWRPDNVLVLLARGDCYTKLESFEEALADYEAVLCFEPDQREARQRIASLHDLWGRKLFALDQPDEAEAEFTNAIKTDTRNPEFYYHRALCRLRLGQGRYALRDVVSCNDLNPTAPHLRSFVARYLEPVKPPEPNHRFNRVRAHRKHSVRGGKGARVGAGDPFSWSSSRKFGSSGDITSILSFTDTSTTRSPTLPDIHRAAANDVAEAGWIRGCQTTLHTREGTAPNQNK